MVEKPYIHEFREEDYYEYFDEQESPVDDAADPFLQPEMYPIGAAAPARDFRDPYLDIQAAPHSAVLMSTLGEVAAHDSPVGIVAPENSWVGADEVETSDDINDTESLVSDGGASRDALERGISTIFRQDSAIKDAFIRNLGNRAADSQARVDRAKTALADFNPSRYSPDERARPSYLAPGDDLTTAMGTLFDRSVEKLHESSRNRSLRLELNDELKALMSAGPGDFDKLIGTVDFGPFIDYLKQRIGAGFLHDSDSVYRECAAEVEADRKLAEIEEMVSSDNVGSGKACATHAYSDTTDSSQERPASLVDHHVKLQMRTATSPESQLLFSVPTHADQESAKKALETFELRDGPSDTTSYHDFSTLQIAFENVWTEVFDGQIQSLGEELYHEYVKLKVLTGTDTGPDRPITTIDDLRRLIDEIRELSRIVHDATPPDLKSGKSDVAGSTQRRPPESVGSTIAKTVIDPTYPLTSTLPEPVQFLLNPAGAVLNAIGDIFG